jgi:hypothetical protein
MSKLLVTVALLGLAGCSGVGDDPASGGRPALSESAEALQAFDVSFTGCVESVGVGLAPTDYARTLVPSDIVLAGEGSPVTPTVVRSAHCDGIAVGNSGSRPGDIVQIGLVIVPPGVPGDIDNYTLHYFTSHEKLAKRLGKLGVDAQYLKKVSVDFETGNAGSTIDIRVPEKGDPSLSLAGPVVPSSASAGSFHANWWYRGCDGLVQMATVVPDIAIGSADQSFDTPVDPALAALGFGNPPAPDFPILQQFSVFEGAELHAHLVD